ncbi:MAG: lipopolysaccharide heptosyltransferase I [Chlamydiales bacterium]
MRLLIIKIGDIGDVVCALPMALFAKERGDKITWVVAKSSRPVLEKVGFIDEIIEVEGFEKRCWFSVLQAWKKIAFRKFDLIVTPYRDQRYALFSILSRGTKKSGFPPDVYRPKAYLQFLSDAEIKWPQLPEKKRTKMVLCVGESTKIKGRFLRAWPEKNYLRLAELIGDGVIVARNGERGLSEFIELLQEAELVITHDCGALHLAKLAGARCLGLFGPTDPKIVAHDEVIVGPLLSCQHCYDGKNYAKCDRALCMENITPEKVKQRVDSSCSRLVII